MKNLTLKQTTYLMVFLLLASGGGFMASSAYINAEIRTITDVWTEFQLVRSDKARLGGQLRATLGYGGMIHNFKDYVLRKDAQYIHVVEEHIGGARMVLNQYRLLPMNETERAAIDDISKTLVSYDDALSSAVDAVNKGKSTLQIDALIKVDDGLALRGIKTLALEFTQAGDNGVQNTKSMLIAEFFAKIGYGGMIHNFKNYVLRGDEMYRKGVEADLRALEDTIARYNELDLSRGENIALEDLQKIFTSYAQKINNVRTMLMAGATVEEIDAKIKVDGAPALRALNFLIHQSNLNIWTHSREMDASLIKIANAVSVATVIELLLIAAITVLFMLLLFKQIIRPMKVLSTSMGRIAASDFTIDIPEPDGRNEISDMTRSLQVLLKSSIKRQEADQALNIANKELNVQLIEGQALREQADEQAVQAVVTAEKLAQSRGEAESAKALAQADEQRMRSIMNTVMDAIITANMKGEIETFNLGAQSIFGYASEEMIGRNLSFLMPEPNRSKHDSYIHSFLNGNPARTTGKVMERVALRKDGTEFPIDITINPLYIGDDITFIGVIRDITERKATEEKIHRLAMTDGLTGLANRNAFNIRFGEVMAQARRRKTCLGLLMIDLDKFKPVNDAFGHPVGDAVLVEVANCLQTHCRETDVIGRLGGDEFVVVLTDLEDIDNALLPVEKIISDLSKPMRARGQTVQIGASIGIAYFPNDADDEDTLITLADNALYAAKKAGRNTYRVHSNSDADTA